MAERTTAEHGLVDALTTNLGGHRSAALLDKLDKAAPWSRLVKPIAALPEYRGGRGRGQREMAAAAVHVSELIPCRKGAGGAYRGA